jgi:serine/threonine-protein kinase RsbW
MDPVFTLAVPGTLDGLAEAVGAAEAFTRKAGVPDAIRRKLLTVLDEVLANVIHHGAAGADGTIALALVIARDGRVLVATVTDDTGPFNPLLVPTPDTTLPLEHRRAGGLGIALVRALADEVAYERRGERNHLTLTWRLGLDSPESEHAD